MFEMSRWLVVALLVCLPVVAGADQNECHTVRIDFTPVSDKFEPQIVMWLEDTKGNYVDTIFITQQTGRYGLGNRPGRFDFNSGPSWPYGRREGVFPVWAHRHGMTFPKVRFQTAIDTNGDHIPDILHVCCESEDLLSHSRDNSSTELHYCAPRKIDKYPVDTITCASVAYTDKGIFSDQGEISVYPPRTDIAAGATEDSSSVADYAGMNPFDAISAATPLGGQPYEVSWHAPRNLPDGSYVLWVEVSQEFDQNATYSTTLFPPPQVQYGEYGAPYIGQPSIVYKLPFELAVTDTSASTVDYAGYGDPDGKTGTLHPPDNTITTAIDRFQKVMATTPYRVQLLQHPEIDFTPPGAPAQMKVLDTAALSARVQFIAPGDDGFTRKAASYDVRARVDGPITDANFTSSMSIANNAVPVDPFQQQIVELTGLLPETTYSVGIRAIDHCGNVGPLSVVQVTTGDFQNGTVDACFVATAAYGSIMANDVEMLRSFRDTALRKSVLGELFVEGYYTFGPPVAGVVGESEILRATARAILGPIVGWVKRA
jgi:hypothetical protein